MVGSDTSTAATHRAPVDYDQMRKNLLARLGRSDNTTAELQATLDYNDIKHALSKKQWNRFGNVVFTALRYLRGGDIPIGDGRGTWLVDSITLVHTDDTATNAGFRWNGERYEIGIDDVPLGA